ISGPWITTSRTLPRSTSLRSWEKAMSCEEARCPGFWKSVNNANSSKTMMTQRAKLRRLAFIDLPSWSRGSRPDPWVVILVSYFGSSFGQYEEIPKESSLLDGYNLGAAPVAAKGTRWDYLAHLRAIPAEIMASS